MTSSREIASGSSSSTRRPGTIPSWPHSGSRQRAAPSYHLRLPELSFCMLVLSGFVSLWHMPLFFHLAGWSLCQSLSARGPLGIARERALRLAVPLLVGCVLFMPVIKYFELSSGL